MELTTRFIPAADEVGRLQSGKDAECRAFQKVAEQGHYAGRTTPSATRQGTYAITPGGDLLTSWNHNNPRFVAAKLREALEKWEQLQQSGADAVGKVEELREADLRRPDRFYPEGGLVLRVNARDLPREVPVAGRWADSWNQDFAWFRKEEAAQFVPAEPRVGSETQVPEALIARLVRFHLVDNVRGETPAFPEGAVRKAFLSAEVTAVEGTIIKLEFKGESEAAQEGAWPVRGFRDSDNPVRRSRGFSARLYGQGEYDLRAERFVRFEMAALGTRWGGTQYNGRGDDMEPAPLGFALTLAGDTPAERVAPASFWGYGWR